jgi:hypothetical protein
MPDECGEVVVQEVQFALAPDDIARNVVGKRIYTKTRFIILKRGEQYALVVIEKTPPIFVDGKKLLFSTILGAKLLASPSDTRFAVSPTTDVLCPTQMCVLARLHKARCMVVQGRGLHVSFVLDPEFTYLDVHDTIPPFEPRLLSLVRDALPLIRHAVIPRPALTYLDKLVARCDAPCVLLPCDAETFEAKGKDVRYINRHPALPEGDVALVGCDLTLRTFRELYPGVKPEFTNICPRQLYDMKGYHIARCCEVKHGFKIKDNLALVSSYPKLVEVASAINTLLKN